MAMINDIGLLVEKQFKNRKSFTTKELLSFMEKWKPAVSASTYIWTIHRLLQEDIIHPLKKGVYTLEKKSRFNPEIDNSLTLTDMTKRNSKTVAQQCRYYEVDNIFVYMVDSPKPANMN